MLALLYGLHEMYLVIVSYFLGCHYHYEVISHNVANSNTRIHCNAENCFRVFVQVDGA